MNDIQNGTNKRDIKQELAIETWNKVNGNISLLCQKIGINRKTFYLWLKDTEFEKAIKIEERGLTDQIQSKLIAQALNGNFVAIKFYLEHKHPEYSPKATSVDMDHLPAPIMGGSSVVSMVSLIDKNT